MQKIRTAVQIIFTCITNAYGRGFAKGVIFMGKSKNICVPGLSCWSCPGALFACPVGAMQQISASRQFTVPFYAFGFVLAVGACLGRAVCGWLCPFGLVQDLLHKIPFPKKVKEAFPGDRILRYLKYVVLVFLVILLPMFVKDGIGQGDPWFCKWLCPSGTLFAGWPLVLMNAGVRAMAGWIFAWKSAILIVLILVSVIVYRPFCKYLCPLGACYGILNKVSLYRLELDEERCTKCQACRLACPMGIDVLRDQNSPECIRCGRCVEACAMQALHRKPILKGNGAWRKMEEKGGLEHE